MRIRFFLVAYSVCLTLPTASHDEPPTDIRVDDSANLQGNSLDEFQNGNSDVLENCTVPGTKLPQPGTLLADIDQDALPADSVINIRSSGSWGAIIDGIGVITPEESRAEFEKKKLIEKRMREWVTHNPPPAGVDVEKLMSQLVSGRPEPARQLDYGCLLMDKELLDALNAVPNRRFARQ